jgi:hypothetical protein
MKPSGRSAPLPKHNLDAVSDGGAESEPDSMQRWCRVTTQSGSVYEVIETTYGEYCLRANNIPNERSCSIAPDRWWRIDAPLPWPPQVGHNLLLLAHAMLAFDDPERIPGGGKITSPVREVVDARPM